MEFKDHLRGARKRAGLTQDQLAERMNVSRVTITNWESGGMPEADKLPKLARVLGVKVGELFDGPSFEVREPRLSYPAPPPGTHYPPVVGTAQLGDHGFWLELNYPTGHGDGFVLYPSKDPNAYALRCKGDSMRPRIKPGEFVAVEPNHAYLPGDEVVIRDKRDRVMVKIFNYERDGVVEVASINHDHQPFTIEKADINLIHYVGGILKASMYYNEIFN